MGFAWGDPLKIKILEKRLDASMLTPKTEQAAGIDLYCCRLNDPIYLKANQTCSLNLGVAVEIPEGYVGMLLPRSSTGKKGLRLRNTVGVIDSDYRGELRAELIADGPVTISPMDRLLQLVVVPHLVYNVEFVDQLSETERGEGGFGSTG